MREYDVAIVGGGIGGIATSIFCKRKGLSTLLIEKEKELGGILWQCIHTGFGATLFGEELTGPEFAEHFVEELKKEDIECIFSAYVLSFRKGEVSLIEKGKERKIKAKAFVFATGAKERTRWQAGIHGTRPAGVFTAGQVQRFLNIEGILPGKRVVIIGGGDVGLIVARHLILEGAEVVGVIEKRRFIGALPRNILFSIHDFNIPVYLGTDVLSINGSGRVESVTLKRDGEVFNLEADTVVLSLGLLPNVGILEEAGAGLCKEVGGVLIDSDFCTTFEGVFVCGNSAFIYEVVDDIVEDAKKVVEGIEKFLLGKKEEKIRLKWSKDIAYCVPQFLFPKSIQKIYLRVRDAHDKVSFILDGEEIFRIKQITPNQLIKLTLPINEGKEEVFLHLE